MKSVKYIITTHAKKRFRLRFNEHDLKAELDSAQSVSVKNYPFITNTDSYRRAKKAKELNLYSYKRSACSCFFVCKYLKENQTTIFYKIITALRDKRSEFDSEIYDYVYAELDNKIEENNKIQPKKKVKLNSEPDPKEKKISILINKCQKNTGKLSLNFDMDKLESYLRKVVYSENEVMIKKITSFVERFDSIKNSLIQIKNMGGEDIAINSRNGVNKVIKAFTGLLYDLEAMNAFFVDNFVIDDDKYTSVSDILNSCLDKVSTLVNTVDFTLSGFDLDMDSRIIDARGLFEPLVSNTINISGIADRLLNSLLVREKEHLLSMEGTTVSKGMVRDDIERLEYIYKALDSESSELDFVNKAIIFLEAIESRMITLDIEEMQI